MFDVSHLTHHLFVFVVVVVVLVVVVVVIVMVALHIISCHVVGQKVS